MADVLGTIEAIWRYPVKSLRGEQVQRADVTTNGLVGDRAYALRDRATGRVLSGKRWARLFECAASYPDGPSAPPTITLPDGSRVGVAAAAAEMLSAWLGRDVELVRALPDHSAEFEIAIQTVEDIEAGVDQSVIVAGAYPCPP